MRGVRVLDRFQERTQGVSELSALPVRSSFVHFNTYSYKVVHVCVCVCVCVHLVCALVCVCAFTCMCHFSYVSDKYMIFLLVAISGVWVPQLVSGGNELFIGE